MPTATMDENCRNCEYRITILTDQGEDHYCGHDGEVNRSIDSLDYHCKRWEYDHGYQEIMDQRTESVDEGVRHDH